jgi:hypothetical protein
MENRATNREFLRGQREAYVSMVGNVVQAISSDREGRRAQHRRADMRQGKAKE